MWSNIVSIFSSFFVKQFAPEQKLCHTRAGKKSYESIEGEVSLLGTQHKVVNTPLLLTMQTLLKIMLSQVQASYESC